MNTKVIFAAAACLAVLGGCVAGIKRADTSAAVSDFTGLYSTTQPTVAGETATTKKSFFSKAETTSETETPTTTAKTFEGYEYAYAGLNPSYAVIDEARWNLLLVNRDYILPDNYEVKLEPSIAGDSSSCKLDYRVAPHYNEMYLAAKEDGITLSPVSGYRSAERQRNNLNNKIAYYEGQGYSKVDATLKAVERILPPGTSEHNAGMAMDICVASVDAHFEATDEYAWLDAHAADYGFILRYPEDKQDVTKITYEPWHWRYVGVDDARAIKASGQCLEEYLGIAS